MLALHLSFIVYGHNYVKNVADTAAAWLRNQAVNILISIKLLYHNEISANISVHI